MSLDLIEVVEKLGTPKVMVIGDMMLDRYIWGDAERISQEAPVVLFRADRRDERLGGAGSVASMLKGLGARVIPIGVVGNDPAGRRVQDMLADLEIDQSGVIVDATRPTTVKERYIGRAQQRHPQQMIRVDYESRESINESVEVAIYQVICQQLTQCDVILISDYDKGVCTPKLLQRVVSIAKNHNIPVIADPIRSPDYRKYHGMTAITPNRLEASLATGIKVDSVEMAIKAASELQDRLNLDAAVVTLDKDGMAYAFRDGRSGVSPTRPRQVYDITGAGDMVLSVLGLCVAAQVDLVTAMRLANIAGGLEVERIGVAILSRQDLIQDIQSSSGNRTASIQLKWLSLNNLISELNLRRANGKRIAFTNGCFDILHAGHVQYLEEAKAQADVLIVAVNSDASVRSLKGPTRPINSMDARCTVLAALQSVDFIVGFDEATPLTLIQAIRPDVLVKGADYTHREVVGASFVESYGGRVHLAKFRDGFSTTNLVQRLRAA